MKFCRIIGIGLLAGGFVAGASGADAAVVFSDNFDSYTAAFNWVPPANWSVPSGSVDLIGAGTSADPFPGNGLYVDLDGTSGAAGTLQTLNSFAASSYTLSFDLGGNARGDVDKTTTITLGNWSTSLTLASSSPYQLYTFSFTTDGGQLSFADNAAGNQDIGNILDNVTLAVGSPVPEPSTWAMMLLGFAGLGYAGYRQTKRASSQPL